MVPVPPESNHRVVDRGREHNLETFCGAPIAMVRPGSCRGCARLLHDSGSTNVFDVARQLGVVCRRSRPTDGGPQVRSATAWRARRSSPSSFSSAAEHRSATPRRRSAKTVSSAIERCEESRPRRTAADPKQAMGSGLGEATPRRTTPRRRSPRKASAKARDEPLLPNLGEFGEFKDRRLSLVPAAHGFGVGGQCRRSTNRALNQRAATARDIGSFRPRRDRPRPQATHAR